MSVAKALAAQYIDHMDEAQQMLESVVIQVAAEQADGTKIVSIPNTDILNTLACERSGDCGCFNEMAWKIVDELLMQSEAEGKAEAVFDSMLAKLATDRIQ
jgi:hypothetical protein